VEKDYMVVTPYSDKSFNSDQIRACFVALIPVYTGKFDIAEFR